MTAQTEVHATGIERLELRPGYHVARLINGGWQLSAGHDLTGGGTEGALDQLERLVDADFTTFDCADIYTGVEELFGRLLRRLRTRGIDREHVQVHTKFVPDLDALARLTPADVERTVDRSLRRLGTDVLDLVQFHWWDYDTPGYVEAAQALEDLRRRGKIRHLGVTNFDQSRLEEIVEAGVDVVAHQCQYSALDQRPAGDLEAFCARRDVHLLAYGTVGGGFLAKRWLGRDAPEQFDNRSQVKYRLIIDEAGGWSYFQRLLAVLQDVSERHNAGRSADSTVESPITPTIVAIRWTLDRPRVAAAIVGTRSARHARSNRTVFGLRLSEEDRQAIDAVVAESQGPEGAVFALEREPEGRHARIMKTGLGGTRTET